MRLITPKLARLMTYGLDLSFLLIHIAMLALFAHYGVKPMAIFNIFSVVYYIVMLPVIRRERFRLFNMATYMEVVLHMSAAEYFVGWNANFQVTLIGMSILMFYAEYVARVRKTPVMPAVPLCSVGALAYLILCTVTHHWPAPYTLPDAVYFWLQIAWGVIVFSITIFFLYTLVKFSVGSEELLSQQVDHDQLTGLPNRYHITEYLRTLQTEKGLENHWVAMADIDDFKHINDTYGHNCGDFILREVADLLQNCGIDIEVCRWGGEEFLLVGEITEDIDSRVEQLERLRRTVMNHSFLYEGTELFLTVTIGMAVYRPDSTIREWISAADQRMYVGKNSGKNQVVV